MIIKVCGMREPENIRAVEQTGTDWMGFVFFKHSARYMADLPAYLPESCKRIGVFVNENNNHILTKAAEFGLHGIQLHGQETTEQCRKLKAEGLEIVKAFSISQQSDLIVTERYKNVCDYFLFDTPCKEYGGSGLTFDWNILRNYHGNTPFLLSGGIRPCLLTVLHQFRHEQLAGIDLNSGFEISPGVKDAAAIHTFITQLNKQHYEQN